MKLLLGSHVPPAVGGGLRARISIEVAHLRTWQEGAHLHAKDDVILRAARAEGRVLVTYDLKTIPSMLKEWGERGEAHGGVIFADDRTFAQRDVGGLVRALPDLIARAGGEAWANRIEYLRRVR